MKIIEILSEHPDLWFGNNQYIICQDIDGEYWMVHNNDSYSETHPDYMRKLYKVQKVEKTVVEWVAYE